VIEFHKFNFDACLIMKDCIVCVLFLDNTIFPGRMEALGYALEIMRIQLSCTSGARSDFSE